MWHLIRPRLARFLYKYRALPQRDSEALNRLRDLLVESRLFLSSHESFNDPFDLGAQILFRGTAEQKRKRFKELLAERSGLPWKQRREQLAKFMARPEAEWGKALIEIFQKNARDIGIFSFAGNPRSILMWSHYSENHEGICLQYDVAKDVRALSAALTVDYLDDYPLIDWVKEGLGTQLEKVMLRKYPGWSYEHEHRIVHVTGARTYYPVVPSALVGVIYGTRARKDVIDTMQTLYAERLAIGLPPLTFYDAVKHPSKYKLVIRKRPGP